MEHEERLKKLQAGKDKLAAFKKKKGRRKKRQHDDGASDVSMSETSSVASVIDMTDTLSVESDQESTSGGYSAESMDDDLPVASTALVTARKELEKAVHRITDLEENLIGKQTLIESLIEENDQLKSVLAKQVTSETKAGEQKTESNNQSERNDSDLDQQISKLNKDLVEREEEIEELKSNLQSVSEQRDSIQAEYTSQAELLAEQVHTLQKQLKQAGDWLTGQMGERGISGQALLEAKNELLALQQVNQQKDRQLTALQQAIKERDSAINQMVERFNDSAHKFNTLQQANLSLQQENRSLKQDKSSAAAQASRLHKDIGTTKHDLDTKSEELAKLKAEVEVLREKYNDWEAMEDEITVLRQKEKQSNEVIQGLMADVENLQKGGILRMKLEGVENVPIEHHKKEIDQLRAELDEMYGDQIVQIKEQLQDNHRLEMERVGRELTKMRSERDNLSAQVEDWQKMYVKLSQAGISDADLTLELQALKNENAKHKMKIDELNMDLEQSKRENEWFKAENEVARSQHVTARAASINDSGVVADNEKEVLSLQSKLDKMIEEKDLYVDKIKQLESELNATKQDADKDKMHLDQKINDIESKLDNVLQENQTLSEQVARHNNEMEEQIKSHSDEMILLQKQYDQKAQMDMEQLQNELAVSKHALQALQGTSPDNTKHVQEIKMLTEAQGKQVKELQEKYKEEIDKLNSEIVSNDDKYKNEIEKLEGEYSESEKKYKEQIASLVEQIKENEESLSDAEHMLNDSKRTYEEDQMELNDEINQLREELSQMIDQSKDLREKLQQSLIDKDAVVDSYEQKLDDVKQSINKQKQDIIDEYERKIGILNNEHKNVIEVMNNELHNKTPVSPLEAGDTVSDRKIKAVLEERDFFKQQVQQLSEMMSAEKSQDDDKCSQLQKQVDTFAAEKQKTAKEMESLRQQVQGLSHTLSNQKEPSMQVLGKLTNEIDSFKDQYKSLTAENDNLKVYYQHATGENQALRDHIEKISQAYNDLSQQYGALSARYQQDAGKIEQQADEMAKGIVMDAKETCHMKSESDNSPSDSKVNGDILKENRQGKDGSIVEENMNDEVSEATDQAEENAKDIPLNIPGVEKSENKTYEEQEIVLNDLKEKNSLLERENSALREELDKVKKDLCDKPLASDIGAQNFIAKSEEICDTGGGDIENDILDAMAALRSSGHTLDLTDIHIPTTHNDPNRDAEVIEALQAFVGQLGGEVEEETRVAICDQMDNECVPKIKVQSQAVNVQELENAKDQLDSSKPNELKESNDMNNMISALEGLLGDEILSIEAVSPAQTDIMFNAPDRIEESPVVQGAASSLSIAKLDADKVESEPAEMPILGDISDEIASAKIDLVTVPKDTVDMPSLEDISGEIISADIGFFKAPKDSVELPSLDDIANAFVSIKTTKSEDTTQEKSPDDSMASYLQQAMGDDQTDNIATCKTKEEFDSVINTAANAFMSIQKPKEKASNQKELKDKMLAAVYAIREEMSNNKPDEGTTVDKQKENDVHDEVEHYKKLYEDTQLALELMQKSMPSNNGAQVCDTQASRDNDDSCKDVEIVREKKLKSQLEELQNQNALLLKDNEKLKEIITDSKEKYKKGVALNMSLDNETTKQTSEKEEKVIENADSTNKIVAEELAPKQMHANDAECNVCLSEQENVQGAQDIKQIESENDALKEQVKVLMLSKETLVDNHEMEMEKLKKSQAAAMRDVDEQFEVLNEQIEQLQVKLDDAEKRVKDENVSDLSSENEKLIVEIEKLKSEKDELSQKLGELESDRPSENDDKSEGLTGAEAQNDSNEVSDFIQENQMLKENVKELALHRDTLEEKLKSLEKDLSTKTDSNGQNHDDIEAKEKQLYELNNQIQSMKEELFRKEKLIEELQVDEEGLQQQKSEKSENGEEELKEKLVSLNEEKECIIKELNEKLDVMKEKNEELKQKLVEANANTGELEASKENNEKIVKELNEKLEAIEKEKEELKSKLEEPNEIIDNFEAAKEDNEKIVKELKEKIEVIERENEEKMQRMKELEEERMNEMYNISQEIKEEKNALIKDLDGVKIKIESTRADNDRLNAINSELTEEKAKNMERIKKLEEEKSRLNQKMKKKEQEHKEIVENLQAENVLMVEKFEEEMGEQREKMNRMEEEIRIRDEQEKEKELEGYTEIESLQQKIKTLEFESKMMKLENEDCLKKADESKEQASKMKEKLRESIKKQVDTAKELAAKSEECEKLVADSAGIESTLEELYEKLDAQKRETDRAMNAKESLEHEFSEKMEKIKDEWEEELMRSLNESHLLKEELEILKENAEEAVKNNVVLQKELSEMQEAVTEMKVDAQVKKDCIKDLEKELQDMKESVEHKNKEIESFKELVNEKEMVEDDLKTMKVELETLKNQHEELKMKADASQEEVGKLQAELDNKNEINAKVIKGLEEDKENLTKILESSKENEDILKEELQNLQGKLVELEDEYNKASNENTLLSNSIKDEKNAYENEIKSLEESADKESQERNELISQLEKSNEELSEKLTTMQSENDGLIKSQAELVEQNRLLEQSCENLKEEMKEKLDIFNGSESDLKSELQDIIVKKEAVDQAFDLLKNDYDDIINKNKVLMDKKKEIEENIEQLQHEVTTLKSEKAAIEQDSTELKESLNKTEQELSFKINEIGEHLREIESLKGASSAKTVECENLQTSCAEVSQNLESIQNELAECKKQLESREREKESLQAEMDLMGGEYRENMEKKNAQVNDLQIMVSRYESENAIMRENKEAVDGQVQHLDNECKTLQKSLAEVQQDLQKVEKQRDFLKEEMEKIKEDNDKIHEQVKSLQDQLEKKSNMAAELTRNNEKLTEDLNKMNSENQHLQSEVSDIMAKSDEMERQKQRIMEENAAMKESFDSIKMSSTDERAEFLTALEKAQVDLTQAKIAKDELTVERDKLNKELSQVKEEMSQKQERHEHDLETLKETNNDAINDLVLKYEEKNNERNKKHSSEIESLKSNYEQTIGEMAETLGTEKSQLTKEYDDAMEMVNEKQRLLEKLQEEVAATRLELESMKLTKEREKDDWKNKLEKTKDELEKEFAAKYKEVENQCSERIAELEKSNEENVEKIMNEYKATEEKYKGEKQSLQQVINDNAVVINELKDSIEDTKKGHEIVLTNANEGYEKQIQENDAQNQVFIDELREQLSSLQDKVQQASVIEAQTKQELEQNKNKVEELSMQNESLKQLLDGMAEPKDSSKPETGDLLEKVALMEAEKNNMEQQYRNMVQMANDQVEQLVKERNEYYTKLHEALKRLAANDEGEKQATVDVNNVKEKDSSCSKEAQDSDAQNIASKHDVIKSSELEHQDIASKPEVIKSKELEIDAHIEYIPVVESITSPKNNSPEIAITSDGNSLDSLDQQRERSVSADSLDTKDARPRTISMDSLDESPAPGMHKTEELIKPTAFSTLQAVKDDTSDELHCDINKLEEQRSMLQASVDNLRASLTDMQQSRYDLQESHDLLQEEVTLLHDKHKEMLKAEGSKDIIERYDSELESLQRKLATIIDEREAMKVTFDEDLRRLTKQLADKEHARYVLENKLKTLQEKHPDVCNTLELDEEISTPSSLTSYGFFGPGSGFSSIEGSANNSPSHQMRSSVKTPDLLALLQQQQAMGGGLFSDSIKLEEQIKKATEMQARVLLGNEDKVSEEDKEVDAKIVESDIVSECVKPAMFGFASESVQMQPESVQFDDIKVSISPTFATPNLAFSMSPNPKTSSPPSLSGNQSTSQSGDLHKSCEAKIARLQEDHEMEMKILEFRLTQGQANAVKEAREDVKQLLEKEYEAGKEELDNLLQQRMQAIEAEKQHQFVEELQKAREELENRYGENLKKMAQKCEESELHQVKEAETQQNQLVDQLWKENKELTKSRDNLMKQLNSYKDQVEPLREELEFVSAQNVHLNQALELQSGQAEMEPITEATGDEWRIKYNDLLTETETLRKQISNRKEVKEGSFTLEGSDMEEMVEKLEHENTALKAQLEETGLGVKDAETEEFLELQMKYDELLKEKDLAVSRLRATGSIDGEFNQESTISERHPLEEPVKNSLTTASSLDEDVIDWKLKYEVMEKENQALRSRLDLESMSNLMMNPPKSPKSSDSAFEFRSQHDLLVEQNELLRAQLGSHGILTERSLEGDVLDPKVKVSLLQRENQEMKERIEQFESMQCSSIEDDSSEKDSSWHIIHEMQDEMTSLRSRCNSLLQENESLHSKLENNIPNVPNETDDAMKVLQQEKKDLINRIMELEAEKECSGHHTNEELQMKVSGLEASLESMASTLEANTGMKNDNERLLEEYQNRYDEKTRENEQLESKIAKLENECDLLRSQIQKGFGEQIPQPETDLKEEMERLSCEKSKLQSALDESKQKIEELEKELSDQKADAAKAKDKAKKDYTKLKAKLAAANRVNEKLQQEAKPTEDVAQESDVSRKSSLSSVRSDDVSVSSLEKELGQLKDENNRIKDENERLQMEINAARKGKPSDSGNKKTEAKCAKLEKQCKSLQEENERLKSTRSVPSEQHDYEELLQKNKRLEEEVDKLKDWEKAENVVAHSDSIALEDQLAKLQSKLDEVTDKKNELKGTVNDLKGQNKQLKEQYESAKQQLEANLMEQEETERQQKDTDSVKAQLEEENIELKKQLSKHSVSELAVTEAEMPTNMHVTSSVHCTNQESQTEIDLSLINDKINDSSSAQGDKIKELKQELSDLQSINDTIVDENRGLLFEIERLELELSERCLPTNGVSNIDDSVNRDDGMVVDVQTIEPVRQASTPIQNIEPVRPSSTPKVQKKAGRKNIESKTPTQMKPRQAQQDKTKPSRAAISKENEMRKQIEKLQKENKALSQKLTDQASKSDSEMMKIKKKLDAAMKEKRGSRQDLRSSPAASASPSQSKKTPKGKGKAPEKEINELKALVNQKEKENDELLKIIRQSGTNPAALSEMKIEYEILLAEKKNILTKFEEEKEKMLEDTEELRERVELLEKEKNEMLEKDMEALKKPDGDVNLERMAKHLEKINEEVQGLKEEKVSLEDKCQKILEEKRESCSALMNDKLQLQQRVSDLTSKVEVLERELASVKSDCDGVVAEREKGKSELENRLKKVEEENASLKEALEGKDLSDNDHNKSLSSLIPSETASLKSDAIGSSLTRPRSSSSLLSVNIPDISSPQGSTRSASPANFMLNAGQSTSEIAIQNELLIAEKKQLCSSLEAAEKNIKELKATVRQLGIQLEKLQKEHDRCTAEKDSQKAQQELLMDDKKDVCVKLDEQKALVKELKKKVASLSKKLEKKESDEKMKEEKGLLSVQLEKSEQDVEIAEKECDELKKRFHSSEEQLKKEKDHVKTLKDELEDLKFRYEEFKIMQRSSSAESSAKSSPRDVDDQKDSIKELKSAAEESDLVSERNLLSEELQKSIEDNIKLKEEIRNLSLQINQLMEKNDLLKLNADDKDLISENKRLKEALDDCVTGRAKLREQVENMEIEIKKYESRHYKDSENLEKMSDELENKEEEVDRLTEENSKLCLDLAREVERSSKDNGQSGRPTDKTEIDMCSKETQSDINGDDQSSVLAVEGANTKDMLTRLHSVEALLDQAYMDMDILHEHSLQITTDKQHAEAERNEICLKIEQMKENLKLVSDQNEKLGKENKTLVRELEDFGNNNDVLKIYRDKVACLETQLENVNSRKLVGDQNTMEPCHFDVSNELAEKCKLLEKTVSTIEKLKDETAHSLKTEKKKRKMIEEELQNQMQKCSDLEGSLNEKCQEISDLKSNLEIVRSNEDKSQSSGLIKEILSEKAEELKSAKAKNEQYAVGEQKLHEQLCDFQMELDSSLKTLTGESDFYSDIIDELKKDVKTKAKEIATLETILSETETKNEELDKKVLELSAKCESLSSNVDDLVSQKQKNYQKFQNALLELEEKILSLEYTVECLQTEKENYRSKVHEVETMAAVYKAQQELMQRLIDNFKASTQSQESELNDLRIKYEKIASEKCSFEEIVNELNGKHLDDIEKNEELKYQCHDLEYKNRDLCREKELIESKLLMKSEELVSLENELKQINDNEKGIKEELQSVKQELMETKHELDLASVENRYMKESSNESCLIEVKNLYQEQISDYKQKVSEIENNVVSLRNELSEAKDQLKVKENDKRELEMIYEDVKVKYRTLENDYNEQKTKLSAEITRLVTEREDFSMKKVYVTSNVSKQDVCGEIKELLSIVKSYKCYSVTCRLKWQELECLCSKLEDIERGTGVAEDNEEGTDDFAAKLAVIQVDSSNLCDGKIKLGEEINETEIDKEDKETIFIEKIKTLEIENKELNDKVRNITLKLKAIEKMKGNLENEKLQQREEFKKRLLKQRQDSIEKNGQNCADCEKLICEVSEAERKVFDLSDEIRNLSEEKSLLELKINQYENECEIKEKRIKELEKQVEIQQDQIHEAVSEHKQTIQLLAQMRLEHQEQRRNKNSDVSRVSESHLSLCYSPSISINSRSRAESMLSLDDSNFGRYRLDTDESEDAGYKSQQYMYSDSKCRTNTMEEINNNVIKPDIKIEQCDSMMKSDGDEIQVEIDEGQNVNNDSFNMHSSLLYGSAEVLSPPSVFTSPIASPIVNTTDENKDVYGISPELVSVREKLLTLNNINKQLTDENCMLRKDIEANHKDIEKLQRQLCNCKCDFVEKSQSQIAFQEQLNVLHNKNAELYNLLSEQKQMQRDNAELLEENRCLERKLKQEKELVKQKVQEKDKMELELLHERICLEKQIKQYHRLEGLLNDFRDSNVIEVRNDVGMESILRDCNNIEELMHNSKDSDRDRIEEVDGCELVKTQKDSGVNSREKTPDVVIDKPKGTVVSHIDHIGNTTQRIEYINFDENDKQAMHHKKGTIYVDIRRKMRYRNVRIQVGESGIRKQLPDAESSLSSRHSTSKPYKGTRLECGCVTELDTMKMYTYCKYHETVNKLRKDLKAVEAKKRNTYLKGTK